MAGELQIRNTTAKTVYAHIRSAVATIWNGSALEAYLTANILTYDVAMVEQGTASQLYVGTFPPTAVPGTYAVSYWEQLAGSPAENDLFIDQREIEWNGTELASRSAWSTVSVVDVGEGRTWVVQADGRVAPTLVIAANQSVTLAMDFSRNINEGASLATADSATDTSGNALPTSNVVLNGDKTQVYFDVASSDLVAATGYVIRVTGTTTDGDTISADGRLQTRA